MTFLWVGLGTAALTAGTSIYGANKQAKASEKAANLQMDQFGLINQQQQPFIQSGYGAMGRLNTLLGLNPNPSMRMSPGQAPTQPPNPGFMPTPGGGMQPIMQVGAPQHDMHIPTAPQQGQMVRMRELLGLRARNGDRQAQAILQRMV